MSLVFISFFFLFYFNNFFFFLVFVFVTPVQLRSAGAIGRLRDDGSATKGECTWILKGQSQLGSFTQTGNWHGHAQLQ
jgi:hypothetical protein